MEKQCEICGKTFSTMTHGHARKYCFECVPHEDDKISHSQGITAKRRAIKKMLVEYAGGKCVRCGYHKCINALEFHHLDPSKKDFGISACLTRSMDELRSEVDKCILVCSNCHKEIHWELYDTELNQFDSDI